MDEINRKVLKHYQIRKTRKQKEEFRKFVVDELKQYGYCPIIQNKGINNRLNRYIGDMLIYSTLMMSI